MKKAVIAVLFALIMSYSSYTVAADTPASLEGTEWVPLNYVAVLVGSSTGFYDGIVWSCIMNEDCYRTNEGYRTNEAYDRNSYWTTDNETGEKHIKGRALPFLGIGIQTNIACLNPSDKGTCFEYLSPMVKYRKKFVPYCLYGWYNENTKENIGQYYSACPEGDTCTCGN